MKNLEVSAINSYKKLYPEEGDPMDWLEIGVAPVATDLESGQTNAPSEDDEVNAYLESIGVK